MHGGEANPVRDARGAVLRRRLAHTFHYWMETEVHVFGFSIAANVLLSFYPFLIVMISVCHKLLGWKTAGDAINLAIRDYFPDQLGVFISSGLPHRSLQIASVFMLLFTANGIFEPLEVALNRAWGVTKNRSYLKNQIVSLGLIFACGGLALVSLMFTAMNTQWISASSGFIGRIADVLSSLFFKLAALPVSMLALFLVYWLLPNRKMDPRRIAPVAIIVGFCLEALKYLYLRVYPLLRAKLEHEYSVFQYSVTIVLWSFMGALIVLAGAHWTANHEKKDPLS
jgi:YihY family inner membrane protein